MTRYPLIFAFFLLFACAGGTGGGGGSGGSGGGPVAGGQTGGGSGTNPAASTTLCSDTNETANLHVRTDGDDAQCDGSADADASAAPVCAFKSIQKAVDTMTAGQTVHVHEGTYGGYNTCKPSDTNNCFKDSSIERFVYHAIVKDKAGGSSSSRFTIKAAPGESVILDGDSVASEPLDAAFFVLNSEFVTIACFAMQDFTAGSSISTKQDLHGVIVANGASNFVEILNNSISNSNPADDNGKLINADISVYNGPQEAKVIGNVIVSHLWGGAIQVKQSGEPFKAGVNSEISNNHITITRDGPSNDNAAAIFPSKIGGTKILNNYVEYTGSATNSDFYGMRMRDFENGEVVGNVFRGFPTAIAIQDTPLSQSNTSSDEEMHIIKNNTFDGRSSSSGAGIQVFGARCNGCEIRNNIFMNFFKGVDVGNASDSFTTIATAGTNATYQVNTAFEASANLVVEGDNRIGVALPVKGITPTPTASDWIGRAIGAATVSAPFYEIESNSSVRNLGNHFICPWTTTDGACDIGAYEFR